jgi:hypothetical protein
MIVLEYTRTLQDSSGIVIGMEGTREDSTEKKVIEQKAELIRLGIVTKSEKGIQIRADLHETTRFICMVRRTKGRYDN